MKTGGHYYTRGTRVYEAGSEMEANGHASSLEGRAVFVRMK